MSVLLAPLLAIFVLDEACLRYYVVFDSELRELLEAWGIGQTGTAAYRHGFCSRALVSEFSYVSCHIVVAMPKIACALLGLDHHISYIGIDRTQLCTSVETAED